MTMRLQNWLYRGGRPNQAARVLDRIMAAIYRHGIASDYLITLEVPGRRSGRIIGLPLVMVVVEGERYLVSMLRQNANWVRNVGAAGGEVILRHGHREDVRLIELPLDRRAPILQSYLKRAPNARAHFPLAPDAPLSEFERLAHRFPVFRVEPRHPRTIAGIAAGDDTRSQQRARHAACGRYRNSATASALNLGIDESER
jgi:hypothetical protein